MKILWMQLNAKESRIDLANIHTQNHLLKKLEKAQQTLKQIRADQIIQMTSELSKREPNA